MNESIIFGKKEDFAIEVQPYKIPQKFYLRLWFKEVAIGSFKRAGSLDYIINSYFKLKKNLGNLYEKRFDIMSERQIFDNIAYDLSIERNPEEESKLFKRLQMFCFEFGDYQFDNYTFIILYCESKMELRFLIYEMDGKKSPRLQSYRIMEKNFFPFYKEFVRFSYENNYKKHLPFFPEGFTFDDIK